MTDASRDEIIDRLAYRPSAMVDGVISAPESTKITLTPINRNDPASLGRLDIFPLEILHEILNRLDIRSISRFSRVSLRGKAAAESLPTYKHLVETIGYIFPVLQQAHVLRRHSCAKLHAVLHSEKCVSCGDYGPFLLILSAERCCYNCLQYFPAVWMISVTMAEKAFGLTKQCFKRLPVLWSIPGKYGLFAYQSCQSSIQLTTVRAAAEAALQRYGSMENLEAKHPEESIFNASDNALLLKWHRRFWKRPPSDEDIRSVGGFGYEPADPFSGMGAIQFPSISSSGSIDKGMWCLGCAWIYQYYEYGMDMATVSRIVPQDNDPELYIVRASFRAWSQEGFLAHAHSCIADLESLPPGELDLFDARP